MKDEETILVKQVENFAKHVTKIVDEFVFIEQIFF
jgi:hypothetical protein